VIGVAGRGHACRLARGARSRATTSETQQADLIDMVPEPGNLPDMRRLPEALRFPTTAI
jgi:hypothetical protein